MLKLLHGVCLSVLQELIVHECSPRFATSVFTKWLADWTLHTVKQEGHLGREGKTLMISPHHFGWPCHRPRSYVVLTRNGKCDLGGGNGDGLNVIHQLFQKPNVPVSVLFCAPQAGFEFVLCQTCCALHGVLTIM